MREGVVLGHRVHNVALLVVHQLALRQFQHQLALRATPLLQQTRQRVGQAQVGHHLVGGFGVVARVALRFGGAAVDQVLRLEIGEALGAADHGLRKALVQHLALGVEADERALAEARHAFLQAAHAVTQRFRQHGHHATRQIGAVAATRRLHVHG